MIIQLTPDLEGVIRSQADKRRSTPESVVVDVLRERFLPAASGGGTSRPPTEDWRARLRALATHCGVSLSDEAVSSEGLYD